MSADGMRSQQVKRLDDLYNPDRPRKVTKKSYNGYNLSPPPGMVEALDMESYRACIHQRGDGRTVIEDHEEALILIPVGNGHGHATDE